MATYFQYKMWLRHKGKENPSTSTQIGILTLAKPWQAKRNQRELRKKCIHIACQGLIFKKSKQIEFKLELDAIRLNKKIDCEAFLKTAR